MEELFALQQSENHGVVELLDQAFKIQNFSEIEQQLLSVLEEKTNVAISLEGNSRAIQDHKEAQKEIRSYIQNYKKLKKSIEATLQSFSQDSFEKLDRLITHCDTASQKLQNEIDTLELLQNKRMITLLSSTCEQYCQQNHIQIDKSTMDFPSLCQKSYFKEDSDGLLLSKKGQEALIASIYQNVETQKSLHARSLFLKNLMQSQSNPLTLQSIQLQELTSLSEAKFFETLNDLLSPKKETLEPQHSTLQSDLQKQADGKMEYCVCAWFRITTNASEESLKDYVTEKLKGFPSLKDIKIIKAH